MDTKLQQQWKKRLELCANARTMKDSTAIKDRLEYLRGEIQGECISYGEIVELQDLVEYIEEGDVELLQWAGVPEFPVCEDVENL